MNPSQRILKYLSSPKLIGRPAYWRVERRLGEKWISPDEENYQYIFSQVNISILPREGLTARKAELEVDLEVEKSELRPYIYTLSPKLEEEFGLPPPILQDTQNSGLNVTADFGPQGGTIGKVGINVPIQRRASPRIIAAIRDGDKKAYWCLDSCPIEGIFFLRTIIGIPTDASKIKIRINLGVEIAHQSYCLRRVPFEKIKDNRNDEWNT